MERYPICTFIRPQILTLTLLWQAISFQCTVLKRSRSDTLLDKDSAIATISSAWENRRTGVASCSCLICKSYPLLDEITRSPNSCPRQDLGADADRFQTLQAASSRNIREKKKLLMTRKHQDLSQPHRTCTTCFRFLKNTPKVKRCLDRGQIMKTTVVSTVVNPTFVDRMEVPPLCLNYVSNMNTSNIWLDLIGFLMGTITVCTPGQVQHELPKPTRLRPPANLVLCFPSWWLSTHLN